MSAGSSFVLTTIFFLGGVCSHLWAQSFLLPPEINTEFDELAPWVSADGSKLFFSRRNHPRNFGQRNAEDIWIAYRQSDGSWSRAVNAGAPLNGRGNNRLVGLNPNETNYYFLAEAIPDTVNVATGLFLSQRKGRSLTTPEPVVIEGYSNLAAKADFHLGPDEDIMMLAIRMEDSYGVRDLYLSRRQPDGRWGAPRNLGPVINSALDEGSPYLAADRRSLYFCRQVAGSLTFYVSRRLDDGWTNWTSPEIIPLPDNLDGAPGPDFTLTAEGDAIILPVIGSTGQFDLCQFPLPPALRPGPVVLISGKVNLPSGMRARSTQVVFYRRDEPEPRADRMALRSDQRFARLTEYGHNLVFYAENAPYFCPAECLSFSEKPCQVPDQEQSSLLERLLDTPEYLDREQVVLDLFQRRQKSFEHLNELDLQLHTFEALSRLELPASLLDSLLASNAALQELAVDFQANFRGSSLGVKGVDGDERSEKNDQELRFMKLRRRFREHLQSQRDTTLETDPARADKMSPERFDVFCRQLWDHYNRQLTPAYRLRLEKEALERQVELQRDDRNSPSGLVAFLEQHRKNVASQVPSISTPDDIIYAEEWLYELQKRASPVIRQALQKIIEDRLRPMAAAHADQLVQAFRRNREYTTIDQEFRSRMQQQMNLEKDLVDRFGDQGTSFQTGAPANISSLSGFSIVEPSLIPVPPAADSRFLLPAVTFEANTASIQPASLRELDRLAAFLAKVPQLSVRIIAHSHAYMTHLRARQLTTARAKKVAEYLSSRGINARRLLPEGMGKMDPLDSNATLEGRTRNQRLEIRLVYPMPEF